MTLPTDHEITLFGYSVKDEHGGIDVALEAIPGVHASALTFDSELDVMHYVRMVLWRGFSRREVEFQILQYLYPNSRYAAEEEIRTWGDKNVGFLWSYYAKKVSRE